jgi:hypothetical protein
MQLIEGSNEIDYLLVIVDFHDYFLSQMIWIYHWQRLALLTCSMIAFNYVMLVVTCSCFGFNAIIVLYTHLFELTFEYFPIPIVKDNKLRLRVPFQPGVMKRILDGCCWLICGFDDFEPTSVVLLDLSLWLQAESVFWMISLLWMDPPDPHKPWPRDTVSDSAILGGSSIYFLRSFFVIRNS